MEESIQDACWGVREKAKELEEKMRFLMNHSDFKSEQAHANQHSEMKANIILAIRHLEDARMRVGKVLQAKDGGKSVYPK